MAFAVAYEIDWLYSKCQGKGKVLINESDTPGVAVALGSFAFDVLAIIAGVVLGILACIGVIQVSAALFFILSASFFVLDTAVFAVRIACPIPCCEKK